MIEMDYHDLFVFCKYNIFDGILNVIEEILPSRKF